MLLKISQNSRENTYARVSFLTKLQSEWVLQLYLKRDSGTSVFLREFSKFLRIPFLHNFSGKHCAKSVLIRSYSGQDFHSFGLNTGRYSVSLRIQSECGKMRTRTTPNTDTFHAVLCAELTFNIINHCFVYNNEWSDIFSHLR